MYRYISLICNLSVFGHITWTQMFNTSPQTVYKALPIGTEESYTTSPTLDHLPIGSKLTPRLMRACRKWETMNQRIHRFKPLLKLMREALHYYYYTLSFLKNEKVKNKHWRCTWARSLLLVFKVFVLIVTGLCTSFASRNSRSYKISKDVITFI